MMVVCNQLFHLAHDRMDNFLTVNNLISSVMASWELGDGDC